MSINFVQLPPSNKYGNKFCSHPNCHCISINWILLFIRHSSPSMYTITCLFWLINVKVNNFMSDNNGNWNTIRIDIKHKLFNQTLFSGTKRFMGLNAAGVIISSPSLFIHRNYTRGNSSWFLKPNELRCWISAVI